MLGASTTASVRAGADTADGTGTTPGSSTRTRGSLLRADAVAVCANEPVREHPAAQIATKLLLDVPGDGRFVGVLRVSEERLSQGAEPRLRKACRVQPMEIARLASPYPLSRDTRRLSQDTSFSRSTVIKAGVLLHLLVATR